MSAFGLWAAVAPYVYLFCFPFSFKVAFSPNKSLSELLFWFEKLKFEEGAKLGVDAAECMNPDGGGVLAAA